MNRNVKLGSRQSRANFAAHQASNFKFHRPGWIAGAPVNHQHLRAAQCRFCCNWLSRPQVTRANRPLTKLSQHGGRPTHPLCAPLITGNTARALAISGALAISVIGGSSKLSSPGHLNWAVMLEPRDRKCSLQRCSGNGWSRAARHRESLSLRSFPVQHESPAER